MYSIFRNNIILCLLLTGTLLFSGCAPVAKTLLGIREINEFDTELVDSFFKECMDDAIRGRLIASTEQTDNMIRLDIDTTMMHYRAQPVQILYFDGDSLVFYHISCFSQSGLLLLDWNQHGCFDKFPPAPTYVQDTHGSMRLTCYKEIFPQLESETRYSIVIFWCNVIRKASQKAVLSVTSNVTGRDDCSIFLINTDHWWADYLNQ